MSRFLGAPGDRRRFYQSIYHRDQDRAGNASADEVAPGKAYVKQPGEKIPMEIAGVISLACADFRGTIAICFRAATFLKIYENMVGEKHERISPEIEDRR